MDTVAKRALGTRATHRASIRFAIRSVNAVWIQRQRRVGGRISEAST